MKAENKKNAKTKVSPVGVLFAAIRRAKPVYGRQVLINHISDSTKNNMTESKPKWFVEFSFSTSKTSK